MSFIGLFHGAIMQSGNALAAWAVPLDHSLKIAHQQAAFVNCSHSDESAMIECLRNVDVVDLVDSEKHFKVYFISSCNKNMLRLELYLEGIFFFFRTKVICQRLLLI